MVNTIDEKPYPKDDLIWLCFLDYIQTFEQAGIFKSIDHTRQGREIREK